MASDRSANLDLEPILAARGIVTARLLDYDWAELSDPLRVDELRELLLTTETSPREAARGSHQGTPADPNVERPNLTDRDLANRDPANRDLVNRHLANRDLAPAAFRHFLDLRARLDAGGMRLLHAIVAASILVALLACVPGRWLRPPAARILVNRLTCVPGRRPRPIPAALDVPSPGGDPPATSLSAVATSGFAAMALELAVLLLFQVIFGNLYLRLSLLVTFFLGGAAIGALVAPRLPWTARAQIRLADAAVALMALALLAVGKLGTGHLVPGGWGPGGWGPGDLDPIGLDPGAPDTVRWIAGYLLLPAFALLAAVPMGVQFAAAGRVAPGATSPLGRLYLADFAGAACGTLVTGLWLLPRGGLPAVIAVVVALKMTSLSLQVWGGGAATTAVTTGGAWMPDGGRA